ncbi:hypothetical protein [Streptomyces sp. CC224B]|uniref:hypothetical protein n=1 Tax=Streptomyces sp. CC224B TaxID=3044571 RepID=UPI0024A8C919|nr:hypothetical protein [Streptomyces sp. CC224B]
MTTTTHAVRVEVAGATMTVVSDHDFVTGWCRRYFAPWWNVNALASQEDIGSGPVIIGTVDAGEYDFIARCVKRAPHTSTSHAGEKMLLTRPLQTYQGEADVTGSRQEDVAMATARLVRDSVRGQLLRHNWWLMHASAAAHGDRVILALGKKGAGKTSVALALAAGYGLDFVADDRVFVRPSSSGGVEVLSWPSAVAVG